MTDMGTDRSVFWTLRREHFWSWMTDVGRGLSAPMGTYLGGGAAEQRHGGGTAEQHGTEAEVERRSNGTEVEQRSNGTEVERRSNTAALSVVAVVAVITKARL